MTAEGSPLAGLSEPGRRFPPVMRRSTSARRRSYGAPSTTNAAYRCASRGPSPTSSRLVGRTDGRPFRIRERDADAFRVSSRIASGTSRRSSTRPARSLRFLPGKPGGLGRNPAERIPRRRDTLTRTAFRELRRTEYSAGRCARKQRLDVLPDRRRRAAQYPARYRMAERLGGVGRNDRRFVIPILEPAEIRRLTGAQSSAAACKQLPTILVGPPLPFARSQRATW